LIGAVASAAACGRVHFDRSDDPDAALDGPTGATCDRARPFSAPVPIRGINSAANETALRLAGDGTGYLGREVPLDGVLVPKIFVAPADAGGFGIGVELGGDVNADSAEDPTLSLDQTTLVFASPRVANYQLWSAHRASATGSFGAATVVAATASPAAELSPYLLRSGKALYFSRVGGGAGTGVAVLRSELSPTGEFGPPTPVSNIAVVSSPVVSEDELELFFTSNNDIYRATRASAGALFANPQKVPELSSVDSDSVTWLSPDGCTAVVVSNRAGGAGGLDLWTASRR
jgi:WD40-like Beta Propeller Repeat